MEQQQIIENNRLIAEFMGYEKRTYFPNVFYSIPYLSGIHKGSFREFQDYDLQFNDNWSWLMPVVEKIESFSGWNVVIKKDGCKIHHMNNVVALNMVSFEDADTKIQAVYKSIIQFINWYNQQQKP